MKKNKKKSVIAGLSLWVLVSCSSYNADIDGLWKVDRFNSVFSEFCGESPNSVILLKIDSRKNKGYFYTDNLEKISKPHVAEIFKIENEYYFKNDTHELFFQIVKEKEDLLKLKFSTDLDLITYNSYSAEIKRVEQSDLFYSYEETLPLNDVEAWVKRINLDTNKAIESDDNSTLSEEDAAGMM